MPSHRRFISAVLLSLTLTPLTFSAGDEFKSGLQPGKDKATYLPDAFQCWMVTGDRAGRYHSPVCRFGLDPGVLIFTRDLDESPKLTVLLKKIDELIVKHPDARLGCCTIFLGDGGFRDAVESDDKDYSVKLAETASVKDELEERLKKIAEAVELKHVLLALDRSSGPKQYQINEVAQLTILLCNKHEVLANFAFKDKLEKDEDVARVAGEIEKTVLEVERLSRPDLRGKSKPKK